MLTCLTGVIWQPISKVSDTRGREKHRFFEITDSSGGIGIGRHSSGRIYGVDPSGLQHSTALPSPLFIYIIQNTCDIIFIYKYYLYTYHKNKNYKHFMGLLNTYLLILFLVPIG